jgi:hypothetical protein
MKICRREEAFVAAQEADEAPQRHWRLGCPMDRMGRSLRLSWQARTNWWGDMPGQDKLVEDIIAQDKLVVDKSALDKLTEDMAGQDELVVGKPAQDKLVENMPAQDELLH